MNYSKFTSQVTPNNQRLRILYLDDNKSDIDSFELRIKKFNEDGHNKFKKQWHVQVTTTCLLDEVVDKLVTNKNRDGFTVFVCDHNMPARKGMDFIKYLIAENVELLHVLYSAGVNVDRTIREECNSKGIWFFDKTEQLSTLIEKLIKEVNELKPKPEPPGTLPMDELYYFIANDIIEDMEKVSGTDYHMRIEGRIYKPEDIIYELKNKTQFAFEYVKNYIEGLKFFNKK